MSSSTNGSREDLSSNKEGDRVGAKLVEERRQEIHGLERVNAGGRGIVLVVEGRNDKHKEAEEEADLLHHFAAVHLVIDEERSEVVTSQRYRDVDQVPSIARHEGFRVVRDDLDKGSLEKLVAIKENIIAKPCASSGKKTSAKMFDTATKGVDIITSDVRAILGLGEFS